MKILGKQDRKVSRVYDERSIHGSLAQMLIEKLLIFY